METERRKVRVVSKKPWYKRSVATEEVRRFIGWNYINDLLLQVPSILQEYERRWLDYERRVNELTRKYRIEHPRSKRVVHPPGRPVREIHASTYDIMEHQSFIVILLKMGGRISELLGIKVEGDDKWRLTPLAWDDIGFTAKKGYVTVFRMGVSKRYDKVASKLIRDEDPEVSPSQARLWSYNPQLEVFEKRIWETEPRDESRFFEFPLIEPLNEHLIGWVEQKRHEYYEEGGTDILFEQPYSYWYWFLRQLDPMKKKYGAQVRWSHIYPHWFRAQRPSQLKQDYGMSIDEIGDWGKWKTLSVVREYTGMEQAIEDKMNRKMKEWIS